MADITTTTASGAPAWLQPYQAGYLEQAHKVANNPYQQYGGSLISGFNNYQTQGLDAQAQRGMSGSPVTGAASGNIQGTLNGDYLKGNPYLQSQIDQAQGDVARNWNNVQKPAWDTSMQHSGSFGNEGVAQAQQMALSDTQRNMGNIAGTMRFNNYASERQNQMQALGLAPGIANQDYTDINAVNQSGNAYQQQDQRGLDSAYQQFQQARDYPKQQLDVMGRALQQSYGTNTTNTQPGPSAASQLFGGAITGAGLYNLMFGKP